VIKLKKSFRYYSRGCLAAKLRERSVIVRHFKQERIAQFLRISIGTPEQNQALIDGLGDL
jgi:histidinol-phosphate aminotransferase